MHSSIQQILGFIPIIPFPPKPQKFLFIPLFSSSSFHIPKMALKAVHACDVPNLDHVHENAAVSFLSLDKGGLKGVGSSLDNDNNVGKNNKFMVIGHRGHGMNRLHLSDPRMKNVKENSILSFNTAASFNVDFIEFDVQVTKDGCPIIFHDNFILTEENGALVEKNVTELSLEEFLTYGPQKEAGKVGKPLFRKTKDGNIVGWDVKVDDALCTLQQTFENVDPKLGFNIELKFDDSVVYNQDFLTNILLSILKVVFEYGNDRPIIFSSFHPDAALLMRKLQQTFPVFFLTNGGTEIYTDVRRNSLEEAMNLCLQGGLQGIVSEVKGIFRNPGAVNKIKEAKLALFTYGTLNNVAESVYLQHLMGVEGVIVDFVEEITEAVNSLIKSVKAEEEIGSQTEGHLKLETKPQFSQKELSFLLKLIPELIQQ